MPDSLFVDLLRNLTKGRLMDWVEKEEQARMVVMMVRQRVLVV